MIMATFALLFVMLQSPKWTFAPASWLAPVFLMWLMRNNKWGFGILWVFIPTLTGAYIANTGVIPFPFPIMIMVLAMGVLVGMLPYLADKWLNKGNVLSTLVFPSSYLLVEFINAQSPSGVWASMANTQYAYLPFIQIADVFGLLGITFIMTWLAPMMLLVLDRWPNKENIKVPVILYLVIFLACNFYGGLKLGLEKGPGEDQFVKVGTVTKDASDIYEVVHFVQEGERIKIPPDVDLSSPELAKAGKSFQTFLSDYKNEKFEPVRSAIEQSNTDVFELSQGLVDAGAEIILWSEGLGRTFIKEEDLLISQGKDFAKRNKVYLVMALASFSGGEVKPGDPAFENKVLTIGPEGEILNTFFKNKPIPYVEASVPGNGIIPVVQTAFGSISPSVCYDADFPVLISQVGKNEVGLLLVPTGDWANIAPYHSYMTRFRAIENGCSIVKATSNGLSVAYDHRGRELLSKDFFTEDDKTMLVSVPVFSVATLFPLVHHLIPLLALVFLLGNITHVVYVHLQNKKTKAQV